MGGPIVPMKLSDGKRGSKWDMSPDPILVPAPSGVGGGISDGTVTAEVRYDDPAHAQRAIDKLNGSMLGGVPIGVRMHGMKNPQLTKLLVTGLPKHTHWIILKNHFNTIGTVAFANIYDGSDKGKVGGKGFVGAPAIAPGKG